MPAIGPSLPKGLLDQVQGVKPRNAPNIKALSRKDARKGEREQKKGAQAQKYKSPAVTKPTRPVKSIAAKPTVSKTLPGPKSDKKIAKPLHTEAPSISRQVQAALDQDDAEIAKLEKKLGIRGKKRKVAADDDFESLLAGIDEAVTGDHSEDEASREWLQQKRRRVDNETEHDEQSAGESSFSGFESAEDGGSEVDDEDEILEDRTEPLAVQPVRTRENPYRPPVDGPKYIPPSLRATNGDDTMHRLRRQLQGQINRLSEANIVSIVGAIEECYRTNARQHVTSSFVEILLGLISDPSSLTDQFIILHAGFVAAMYKILGTEFGAFIVERVVRDLKTHLNGPDKQSSNLLAFLSELYNLDVIGCPLMYDYIRLLIDDNTEISTEILLRIIRHCGPHLRQDDPQALKEIATRASHSAATSVRQKFMLETLSDLQSNRAKPSTLITEHVSRLKKTLGTLKSRQLRANEPLRITMADLANTDKRGKWWLVGASVQDVMPAVRDKAPENERVESDSLKALTSLAREQGMNTDVRRAVFVSIMSATDYKDAHLRLIKLDLKKSQSLEIPRVLVHCIGAEQKYNHFYTLIAGQFVGEKKMATTFRFCLWDFLKRLDDDEAEVSSREMFNMAKMYAFLMSKGLGMAVFKKLEFTYLSAKTSSFLEVLFTSLINDGKSMVFMTAQDAPDMVAGLKYFVHNTIAESDMLKHKEDCTAVVEMLT